MQVVANNLFDCTTRTGKLILHSLYIRKVVGVNVIKKTCEKLSFEYNNSTLQLLYFCVCSCTDCLINISPTDRQSPPLISCLLHASLMRADTKTSKNRKRDFLIIIRKDKCTNSPWNFCTPFSTTITYTHTPNHIVHTVCGSAEYRILYQKTELN